LHEEVWVGTIGDAITQWSDREPRGEFTVVVAPGAPEVPDVNEAVARARRLVEEGISISDAAREIGTETGVPRRTIYQELLDVRS
jgi:16S rRNA (cytidine1402-2'-O)-methyltransferase